MITTTKQEIRKAVMLELEKWSDVLYVEGFGRTGCVPKCRFPSVADLVADKLGGEG